MGLAFIAHTVQFLDCEALSFSVRASPLRVLGFVLAMKV